MFYLVLAVILCSVFVVWSYLKPHRPSPPMYPGALPLIGHGYLFLGEPSDSWKWESKVYDYSIKKQDVIKGKLGLQSVYVISDPDDALKIANNCLDKPYIYSFAKDYFGIGLVTADLKTWKPHRKLLNPSFNQQLIQELVKEYSIQAKLLVSQLASKVGQEPFDVHSYFSKSILISVYKTSMGLKTDEHTEIVEKYVHATEGLFSILVYRVYRVWLHLPQIFNLTSAKKNENILSKQMKDITNEIIKNRKTELKGDKPAENLIKQQPLLDQLLDLTDKQDAFSDDEIREHLDTITAAAYDTTASALTFILILLGSHHDVQERVYNEVQEIFGDDDRHVTRHDLPKLVYMEAVIKEALRLFPPVPRFARTSKCVVKLKDYIMPAHSMFMISVYAINRHPMWGPDADQFRPDRWLDPALLPQNPNAFASFSLGKRNCIGKLYAIMAVKTTLAQVLRNYRIISDISQLQLQCHIMLKPFSGNLIRLETRK